VNLTNLSNEQKLVLLEEIQKKKEELKKELKKVRKHDPYWFYQPSKTGDLPPEAKAFAEKWLYKEDVPTTWVGMDSAIRSTARIVGVFGGNRAGKTVLNAIMTHAKVTGDLPQSMIGLFPDVKTPKAWPVFGRVYGSSAPVIEEVLVPKFKEWMPKKYWHKDGWERTYNKQDKIIRYYKNGDEFIGHVKFISGEQDVEKTQGVDLAFAHFDEEPSHEFYEEALARFGTTVLDIAFFMTPTNGMSWTYDLLVDNQDPNVECFKISSLTNQYIDFNSLELIVSQQDSYEKRKMRLLGEHVSLSGLIYSGENAYQKSIHLVKPFKMDWSEHIVYRGLDMHLAKEAACVEIAVVPDGRKFVVGVYYKKGTTDDVKADLAKRAVERKYRLGWTRYDKSLDYEIRTLGDVNIMQMFRQPPNPIPALIPSEKYKGSIEAGVDQIKQDLRDKKLFFFDIPEMQLLIKNIQTLEREKGINEDKKGVRDKIAEGKKDLHAAMRYAFQGHMNFIPVELEETTEETEERFL
jgi:phage terminase large subunit-like protein